MLKTDANPGGLPAGVFDAIRDGIVEDRSQYYQGAYDCVQAFSETDTTKGLKTFDVPTLIIHGDDDQIVPIGAAALQSSKIVKDEFNTDLLNFLKS